MLVLGQWHVISSTIVLYYNLRLETLTPPELSYYLEFLLSWVFYVFLLESEIVLSFALKNCVEILMGLH